MTGIGTDNDATAIAQQVVACKKCNTVPRDTPKVTLIKVVQFPRKEAA